MHKSNYRNCCNLIIYDYSPMDEILNYISHQEPDDVDSLDKEYDDAIEAGYLGEGLTVRATCECIFMNYINGSFHDECLHFDEFVMDELKQYKGRIVNLYMDRDSIYILIEG